MYMRKENHPPLVPPLSIVMYPNTARNPPFIRRSCPRYPPLSGCTCHTRQRSQQFLRFSTFQRQPIIHLRLTLRNLCELIHTWPLVICNPCATSPTVLMEQMMWCTPYASCNPSANIQLSTTLRNHRHDVIRRHASFAPKDMLWHTLLLASRLCWVNYLNCPRKQ